MYQPIDYNSNNNDPTDFLKDKLLFHKLDKWHVVFKNILVNIDTTASLESFRKFIIVSTCKSFIPESYFVNEHPIL